MIVVSLQLFAFGQNIQDIVCYNDFGWEQV